MFSRSKAVADGAIGFYCDHHVSARVSKFMYGVEYLRTFDAEDETHVARRERLCELPSGPTLLPDAFDCILSRVSTHPPHAMHFEPHETPRMSRSRSPRSSPGNISQNLLVSPFFRLLRCRSGAIEDLEPLFLNGYRENLVSPFMIAPTI